MADYTPKSLVLSKGGNTYTYNLDGKLDKQQAVGDAGKVLGINSSGVVEATTVDLSSKVDKQQAVGDAGKVLGINSSGVVTPTELEDAAGAYYGESSTAKNTQQKAVTITGGAPAELKTGMMFAIKFTTNQEYNGKPTLKIGDLAAVSVNNGYRYMWVANDVVNFIYNGTYFMAVEKGIATTTCYGVTKLVDGVTSTSTALAATGKAAKTAYDAAVTVMTGASSSAAGAAGRVPAPASGDQEKFLRGDGTWQTPDSEGTRLWTVDLDTVTVSTAGSYTHTTTVTNMSGSMKAAVIECGHPEIFKAPVVITTATNSVTLTCSSVAVGSSTVKVSFLMQGDNASPLSSGEYNALSGQIGTLADLNTDVKTNLVAAVNSANSNIPLQSDMSQWDTNEVAVGKWVDGRTIYRKYYSGTTDSSSSIKVIDSRTNIQMLGAYGYTVAGSVYHFAAASSICAYDNGVYIDSERTGNGQPYALFLFYVFKP